MKQLVPVSNRATLYLLRTSKSNTSNTVREPNNKNLPQHRSSTRHHSLRMGTPTRAKIPQIREAKIMLLLRQFIISYFITMNCHNRTTSRVTAFSANMLCSLDCTENTNLCTRQKQKFHLKLNNTPGYF